MTQSPTRVGWDDHWASLFEPHMSTGLQPARVSGEYRGTYTIHTEHRRANTVLAGRVRHGVAARGDLPAVGDSVAVHEQSDPAVVHTVLPRRTEPARKVAGDRTVQELIAANVDVAFIVVPADARLNERRLERFPTIVWQSGADAVVVVSKSDLCAEPEAVVERVRSATAGVTTLAVSAITA